MEQKKVNLDEVLKLVREINFDEFQNQITTGNSLEDVYQELVFLSNKMKSKKERADAIIEHISGCYEGDFFNYLPISENRDELDVFCMGFNTYIEELEHATVSKNKYEIAIKDLLQEKERSESLSKSKDVFMASMSHEIRTPLNGILGFVELLLKNKSLDDDSKRHLEFIKLSGDILLVIINDILDLVKIETGEVALFNRAFDFTILTQLINETFTKKIKDKKHKFSCKIEPNVPPTLFGDSIRISQVLFNLINNAIKFTPEKGKIRLKVKLLQETETTHTIAIIVKDNGIGIPEDKLESIFNPFEQVTTDNSRTKGGAGLGLTIVKKLTEMMGGKIEVKSVLNSGSRFKIILPLNKIVENQFSSTVVKPKTMPMPEITFDTKINVLLAEDNRINQILVQKVLDKHNINCITVANGQLAVEAVKDNDFDLILMDIMMPVMDGYEATTLIRGLKDKEKSSIPIIALTAIVTGTVVEDSATIGFDKYISKPFDAESLTSSIYELVSLKKGRV